MGKTFFLYPGQGSQHVGMGMDLFTSHPDARMIFEKADDTLGYPLTRLCFEGPEEELGKDLNSQLAIYTVSCAMTHVLQKYHIIPDAVTGYSSGFYAAAYSAGCFDFEEGLRIVKRAGEILLEEAASVGGRMAVIFGLSKDKVEAICREVDDVEVAIVNTPHQVIISGMSPSVEKAMERARMSDALDTYHLPGSVAYHSRLAESSGIRLIKEIEDERLRDPRIPLISYLTLEPVATAHALKCIISEQLSRQVRWVDLIRKLGSEDECMFVELGPGKVISRTIRWIDRGARIIHTGDVHSFNDSLKILRAV